MTEPASDAETARQARNSAKVRMEKRFSALQGGYAQMGIGSRVSNQVSGKVREAAQEAIEVARESKGVIVGTVGVLGFWLARRSLMSIGRSFWAKARARIDKGF